MGGNSVYKFNFQKLKNKKSNGYQICFSVEDIN